MTSPCSAAEPLTLPDTFPRDEGPHRYRNRFSLAQTRRFVQSLQSTYVARLRQEPLA